MGLAERRAMAEIQEKDFPGFKKAVDDAAGFAVNLSVQWDTLAVDGYAHVYKNGLEKVFFTPLAESFRAICTDDMGRKALQAGLKEVVIKNSDGYFSPNHWSFEGGVLTLDHNPISNIDLVNDRVKALVKLLEKNL